MKSASNTHFFLTLTLILALASLASAHIDVSQEEAKALIEGSNPPLILDVREASEYCGSYGHISGALNYPYSSGVLEENYTDFSLSQPILVICQSGGRSNSAAKFLDGKNFTTVYDMLGGMRNWQWETVSCVDQYSLTVNSTGNGSTTGSGTFNVGSSVPVVATANANYHFVNWTATGSVSVTNSGSASTTVSVNGVGTVTAHFALDQHTVNMSSTAGGSITYPGEGALSYAYGTEVVLIAISGATYDFVNWTGTAVTAGKVANPISAITTVTVDGDYTLKAVFKPNASDALYVDANAIENLVQDGTKGNPFALIQPAIDAAEDGETVVVLPGLYVESLNFKGKAICVMSLALADVNALVPLGEPDRLASIDTTIIHGNYEGPVVVFESGEDANAVLSGFTLTGGLDQSGGAIRCYGSSPTITHCVITGNRVTGFSGGVVDSYQSAMTLSNCTIADNVAQAADGAAIVCEDSYDAIVNCIVWDNEPSPIVVVSGHEPLIQYSDIQGKIWPGEDNISEDPWFALAGQWVHPMYANLPVDASRSDAHWVLGDYHVQSTIGRYDPDSNSWVTDANMSPCIDLGDPNDFVGQETAPHGDRINAGAYGGTWMASRTLNSELQTSLEFVTIDDPGVSGHEGFKGQMSKYETTNDQYCQYLNAALASGDIMMSGNDVVGANGTNLGTDYVGTTYYNGDGLGYTYNGATKGGAPRIYYSAGMFRVDPGFNDHPVTYVSWYGATAFAAYYGCRLPTEWEWQAVADYDGSYTYGCGPSTSTANANYLDSIHPDGTTSVGGFGEYGYSMGDMAGNVWEWTSTVSGSNRIMRGGSWSSSDISCTVRAHYFYDPNKLSCYVGFRVCR